MGLTPFESVTELSSRYGPSFTCRAVGHTPCGEYDGDWALIELRAQERIERELLADPVLDYEHPPKRRPQPASSRTKPGRVRFDTDPDPLKNGDVLEQYIEAQFGAVSSNGRFRCIVPDHPDHHPSAQLWPDGRWRCWSCGASGDVIDAAAYATGREPRGADYWWLRDHVLEVLLRAPLPSERGAR
jgi:hypothetical protein